MHSCERQCDRHPSQTSSRCAGARRPTPPCSAPQPSDEKHATCIRGRLTVSTMPRRSRCLRARCRTVAVRRVSQQAIAARLADGSRPAIPGWMSRSRCPNDAEHRHASPTMSRHRADPRLDGRRLRLHKVVSQADERPSTGTDIAPSTLASAIGRAAAIAMRARERLTGNRVLAARDELVRRFAVGKPQRLVASRQNGSGLRAGCRLAHRGHVQTFRGTGRSQVRATGRD